MESPDTSGARPCRFCGDPVTSPNEAVDYCRVCFYSGTPYEWMLRSDDRDMLARIGALDKVTDATVWHTGGGCFVVAITLDDGRFLTPSAATTDLADGTVWAEPGLPGIDSEERWALVVSESQEAWNNWDESKIKIVQRTFDDDELVEAVRETAAGADG